MGSDKVIDTWLARFLRHRGRDKGTTDAQEAQPDRAAAIGGLGEALVAGHLREMGWPILRNLILRGRCGSAEIDLLARSPSAVVAVEVKTWSGFIQGTTQAASWVRHGGDGRGRTVPNAVRQNLTHVTAVERAIGDSGVPVWGIVVSAGHARFAALLRPHVVPASAVGDVLRTQVVQARLAGQDQLDRAWARLRQEAERSPGRREAHVAWLRSRDRAAGNCE